MQRKELASGGIRHLDEAAPVPCRAFEQNRQVLLLVPRQEFVALLARNPEADTEQPFPRQRAVTPSLEAWFRRLKCPRGSSAPVRHERQIARPAGFAEELACAPVRPAQRPRCCIAG